MSPPQEPGFVAPLLVSNSYPLRGAWDIAFSVPSLVRSLLLYVILSLSFSFNSADLHATALFSERLFCGVATS